MMLSPQRGREKDPSPDLVPRPPSPLGEGWGFLGAPPHVYIIALSLGERGDRKAVGEGSFPNARRPSRNVLPDLSNYCCHPGRAGGSPNGLADRPGRHPLDHRFGEASVQEQNRKNRDHEACRHHAHINLVAAHKKHDAEWQGALAVIRE